MLLLHLVIHSLKNIRIIAMDILIVLTCFMLYLSSSQMFPDPSDAGLLKAQTALSVVAFIFSFIRINTLSILPTLLGTCVSIGLLLLGFTHEGAVSTFITSISLIICMVFYVGNGSEFTAIGIPTGKPKLAKQSQKNKIMSREKKDLIRRLKAIKHNCRLPKDVVGNK